MTRALLVLVIWLAGLLAAAQYGKISVIFDKLPLLFPEAGAGLGFAVSLVGFVGMILGVLAGALVAAVGYRRTLIGALALGGAVSLVQSLPMPFWLFLITRLAEGVSHLGVVVAGPTLIAHIASDRWRPAAMTLWGTFFGVAFAILAAVVAGFTTADQLRWLFAGHGLLLLAFAVALTLILSRIEMPERGSFPKATGLIRLHLDIYRSPHEFAPAVGWIFYTICFVSILTVLPPYIGEESRVMVMTAMPLVSIFVSLTLGVGLMRWLSGVQVVMIGFAASTLGALWLLVAPGAPVACIYLAASMGLIQGATFAALPQLNLTAQSRARASGAMAQTGNFGNTIGTPLMVAVLAIAGYPGMMITTALLFVAGIGLHLWLAARRN